MSARVVGILARAGWWLWLPALAITGAVVWGMIAVNQTSDKCMQCHHDKLLYHPERIQEYAHLPYKEGRMGCVDCHTQRSDGRHVAQSVRSTAQDLSEFTTPSAMAKTETADYPTDAQCIGCHYRILEVNEVERFPAGSERLAAIGLRFEHALHARLRDYTPEDDVRYLGLSTESMFTRDELEELEMLDKIRVSACALCHERNRVGPSGDVVIDKTVNYFTRNPMSCFACHPDTGTAVHPGNSVRPPNESTCRTCHNGKLHGRIPFFEADCQSADRTHCVKCHPRYVPPAAAASLGEGDGR